MENHDGTTILDVTETLEAQRGNQPVGRELSNAPLLRPDNEPGDGGDELDVEGDATEGMDEGGRGSAEAGRELDDGDFLPEEETMSRRGGLRHDKRLARKKSNVKGAKQFKQEYGKSKSLKEARRKYNRSSRKASKQQLKNYNK